MPEEEEPLMYERSRVPDSWITASTNPRAEGWYEEPENPWEDYILTEDESPVSGKAYYYDPNTYQGGNSMSETALAYSTYQTYLMYRTSTGSGSTASYTKLVDIKDYPDMIGDPNMLDATTLSDKMEKQIAGIIRMGDGYVFTANYTPTAFTLVQSLEGHQYDYALWLGGSSDGTPSGNRGKFSWTGDVRAGFPGKGVDDVAEMSITCTPSVDTKWEAN